MSHMLGLLGTRYHIIVEIQPFDIQYHGKGMMKWEKCTVNCTPTSSRCHPKSADHLSLGPTAWSNPKVSLFQCKKNRRLLHIIHIRHACQILQQCNIPNKLTTLEILPRHFWITPYQSRLHIRHLQLMMYCQEWWSRKYLLQCRIHRSWKKVLVPVICVLKDTHKTAASIKNHLNHLSIFINLLKSKHVLSASQRKKWVPPKTVSMTTVFSSWQHDAQQPCPLDPSRTSPWPDKHISRLLGETRRPSSIIYQIKSWIYIRYKYIMWLW